MLTRTYNTWCEGCGQSGETSNINRSYGSCLTCKKNRVVELLFLDETESSNDHLRLIMDMRRVFEFGYDRFVNASNIAKDIRLYLKNRDCIIP